MPRIDLNSDLGESFGAWRMGDDDALLAVVTSANVACGFHAGDPLTMLATCRSAARRGVSIGAHPGYRDLVGFGRRDIDMPLEALQADVLYQVAALDGIARHAGSEVRYIKPHGALYNRCARDVAVAEVVASVARDRDLPLVGLAGSLVADVCDRLSVRFIGEAFVDRGYHADGRLVARSAPGAVVTAPDEIAARAVRMVVDRTVETVDGTTIRIDADTLCLHGDTPGAVTIAHAARSALTAAGVTLSAFTSEGA